jgi:hypothetical protein
LWRRSDAPNEPDTNVRSYSRTSNGAVPITSLLAVPSQHAAIASAVQRRAWRESGASLPRTNAYSVSK